MNVLLNLKRYRFKGIHVQSGLNFMQTANTYKFFQKRTLVRIAYACSAKRIYFFLNTNMVYCADAVCTFKAENVFGMTQKNIRPEKLRKVQPLLTAQCFQNTYRMMRYKPINIVGKVEQGIGVGCESHLR